MEQSTKLLGGIAYLCMVVFAVWGSFYGPISVVSLIATICVLIAFVRGGNETGQPQVKNDIIIAVVLYIVAMILMVFLLGAGLEAMMASDTYDVATLGAGALIGGFVGWILFIVAAWFWYRASRGLTDGTGVGLFKIGGLLMFIGAILAIIGIGFILSWIGELLQCIAFFTAPEKGVARAGNAT